MISQNSLALNYPFLVSRGTDATAPIPQDDAQTEEDRRLEADRNFVQDRERRDRNNLRQLVMCQNDYLRATGELR